MNSTIQDEKWKYVRIIIQKNYRDDFVDDSYRPDNDNDDDDDNNNNYNIT
jgi:hypothetical protein